MPIFKDFEIDVVKILTRGKLGVHLVDRIIADAEYVDFYYTGCGYFLTVTHPEIPLRRIVCSEPMIEGIARGVSSGFVVFLEKHELTIECHSLDENVFEGYRDLDVEIMKPVDFMKAPRVGALSQFQHYNNRKKR